jgi:hypothetical protein
VIYLPVAMLDAGQRLCDFCGDAIAVAADYDVITIPAGVASAVEGMLEAEHVTMTRNADGSGRLDVCVDCRMRVGRRSSAIH